VPSGVRERGSFPYDPEGPGVGVSGVSLEWIGTAVLILFVVLLLFPKKDTWILPIVIPTPLITLSEVSERIATLVRNIVLQVFEVATPIVNIVAIAQIIIGLLLWFGARQEFLGWRLLAAGILMLIFMNVVAPMLMQFI
jgi:hypothetical protein